MYIQKTVDENKICTINLNRPEKRNALNLEMINQLILTLREIKQDTSIRGVIIRGKGTVFSAGGDITEMVDRYGKALVTKNRLDDGLNKIVLLIREIRRPILAVINGSCFGAGLVIATACDVIYCSETANFGFSHGNVGLIPEASYFVSRFIGLHKAKELIFSRSVISANEAQELNFVTRVIEGDKLLEYSYEKMKEWVAGPVESMGLAKEVLNHAFEEALDPHLKYEALAQGAAFTGTEHKKGVDAFLNKREAKFR